MYNITQFIHIYPIYMYIYIYIHISTYILYIYLHIYSIYVLHRVSRRYKDSPDFQIILIVLMAVHVY